MTNPSTEKLTGNCHNHVAVDAVPSATLEVIPAEFFFGFAKARFDFPASERHPQQLANRQAISTGDSIADEVLHFTSANILGNDQGALRTDHSAVVSLAVDDMPTNFPNLRTFLRVPRAVTLRCLRGQTGRVLGQVLHLASLRVAGGQARVLLLSFLGFISRLSQYFGLSCPCVKVWRNLTYERLLTFIKPIKKLAVTTVKFIKSPGLHRDAIGDHFVDQHQCDLRLGQALESRRSKRQSNTDARILDFATIAVVLSFDSNGFLARFGRSGFVDHADGLWVGLFAGNQLAASPEHFVVVPLDGFEESLERSRCDTLL